MQSPKGLRKRQRKVEVAQTQQNLLLKFSLGFYTKRRKSICIFNPSLELHTVDRYIGEFRC